MVVKTQARAACWSKSTAVCAFKTLLPSDEWRQVKTVYEQHYKNRSARVVRTFQTLPYFGAYFR